MPGLYHLHHSTPGLKLAVLGSLCGEPGGTKLPLVLLHDRYGRWPGVCAIPSAIDNRRKVVFSSIKSDYSQRTSSGMISAMRTKYTGMEWATNELINVKK
jgi:hypothetical protein